jgi:hypothetical protein
VLGEPDALDRVGDGRPLVAAERPEDAARWEAAGRDDLANGRGGVEGEGRALLEIADSAACARPGGRLAEEERLAVAWTLEPEHEPHQRRLAAAVRSRDRDELALRDLEADPFEDGGAAAVAEADVAELDG